MQFLPFWDVYNDLTYKTLGILDFFIHHSKAAYVYVHDDDYCAQLPVTLNVISEHERDHAGEELYAG